MSSRIMRAGGKLPVPVTDLRFDQVIWDLAFIRTVQVKTGSSTPGNISAPGREGLKGFRPTMFRIPRLTEARNAKLAWLSSGDG